MSCKPETVKYSIIETIAVIELDKPPVNSLGQVTRACLQEALNQAKNDSNISAVVLIGAGQNFSGGADILEFQTGEIGSPDLNVVCSAIECLGKPVIAAIDGFALGGGLELALSCHCRVATRSAQLGLPEVLLGVLPGAGGTQRLPRLVGARKATEMILGGVPISAESALISGLIDAEIKENLLDGALDFARKLVDSKTKLRTTSSLQIVEENLSETFFFDQLTISLKKNPTAPAPAAIIKCIKYAVLGSDFNKGLAVEGNEFVKLMNGPYSKALRHLFFAEREALKIPSLTGAKNRRKIEKIGVVGAGTMGGGIAMNFLNAGIPVILLELDQIALERGIRIVRENYVASAHKGKITMAQIEERMALLHGALEYDELTDCDLVIEAVFENLEIKKSVCRKLGQVCKPGAIIATNTSTLNVDLLAEVTGRPHDFLGMHFFSPANVMKLLEVVRGAITASDVLDTVISFAKKIGKIPVVSGVCYGFIGNRMLEGYLREVDFLLLEGATPAQIDRALESFGMAMGPCRMIDMAGVDVNAKVMAEREKVGMLPPHPAYRCVTRKLGELGRNGQKSGIGYYLYEGRTQVPDPELENICEDLARRYGIQRRNDIGEEEICNRCLYPLINEGFRILEEKIAYRSGDIDVVWTAGYGFPRGLGGPMYMAEQLGLRKIYDVLLEYGSKDGDVYGFWKPAERLVEFVASSMPENVD